MNRAYINPVNVIFITSVLFMELVWNIVKYNFIVIMKELVSSYFIPVTIAMK